MQPEGSLVFGLFGLLVFLGGRVGAGADVEAEVVSGAGRIIILILHVDGHAFGVEHFDVQGQGLHFLQEHP